MIRRVRFSFDRFRDSFAAGLGRLVDDFRVTLAVAAESLQTAHQQILAFYNDHKIIIRRILLGIGIGVTIFAVAAVFIHVILPAVGFTAGGIVGGSIASRLQSLLFGGYILSSSWFALFQSAAMGGYGVGTIYAITAILATTLGIGGAAFLDL